MEDWTSYYHMNLSPSFPPSSPSPCLPTRPSICQESLKSSLLRLELRDADRERQWQGLRDKAEAAVSLKQQCTALQVQLVGGGEGRKARQGRWRMVAECCIRVSELFSQGEMSD